MSVLMTICIRKRTVSLSWIMKCQRKRDNFHILHCHQDDDFEILARTRMRETRGWRKRAREEGQKEEARGRLTVIERGNHRSAWRRWIETRDYTQTWLPVMHHYSFPLYYQRFSWFCSAVTWLVYFLLGHLVQKLSEHIMRFITDFDL